MSKFRKYCKILETKNLDELQLNTSYKTYIFKFVYKNYGTHW